MSAILSSPAVKALVVDFVLTLGVAYAALSLAPTTFQDLIAVGDVLAFAVFKSAIQATVRGVLKWGNS